MKDRKKLINLIEQYAVGPYKQFILHEIRPTIRLRTTGTSCEELGKTKLGGCPDLPQKISWPSSKKDGSYLSFLGQINLEDISGFDEADLLPKTGMLYFFFHLDSGDDGKVIFSDAVVELKKAVAPEAFKEQKRSLIQRLFTVKPRQRILKESQVEIYKEYSIPSWGALRLARIQKSTGTALKPLNAFREEIFEDSYEEEETETTANHRLIGNYRGIQHEYHELNFIETKIEDVEKTALPEIEKALKWRLLFQLDSDDKLNWNYLDGGRIYFFIHEDDLKNKNFENVKISVDCY